jgi:hypothetical protein
MSLLFNCNITINSRIFKYLFFADDSGVLGHVGADFGAVAAGGGADAAVFHVGVVFAFPGATVTDAFAKLAKLLGEIAV